MVDSYFLIERKKVESAKQYDEIFRKVFELSSSEDVTNLEYQGIENWDSLGHMALVAELEKVFNISLDMDEVIDLSSYKQGKEILRKHNVKL